MTPEITIEASSANGIIANTEVKHTNDINTIVAVTTALRPLCAPLSLFTALRLKLPVTGYPPNSPEVKFAMPRPTSSMLLSNS
mmetsp:Transcript_1487/g.3442  ORF Transcript_1487/g.3442 Transcript_1487/m.3442 type:complete len:83 (-) Transcript_1487:1206-1454(-)